MTKFEEVLKSELDLFKNVSYQQSIDHSLSIQYRPTSALTESSAIEFDIPISSDEYLDLRNIFLSIKGKLVKKDGTDFTTGGTNDYSLINYSLNTVFDQLTIYLGSTMISQSSNTYHYLSIIEALTQYNEIQADTLMKSSGYFHYVKTDIINFDHVDARIENISTKSKVFTLYGKIHGSIFTIDKLMLGGLNLRLIFNRASPQFYCMVKPAETGATANEPKLNLMDISIFVRKVKVYPQILEAHNEALKISKAIYPIKRSQVKVMNLTSGLTTFNLDNVFLGQLPCKMICGLVSNDAYSGKYTANPFAFKNFGLNYLSVNINGESWPKTPYEPDYRTGYENYRREFHDFFINIGNSIPAIDYSFYKDAGCLYAFNFNSDFENPTEDEYINLPKAGFLNIEIKFNTNLTGALKLIVYAQFDNQIQIDESRNVIIDY